MLDGRCFYFETRKFDYENAKLNCETKFSSGGKIFEPMTKSMNDRVYGEFEKITGTMAIPVVEFSGERYKIRKFFGKELTNPKEIIEFSKLGKVNFRMNL